MLEIISARGAGRIPGRTNASFVDTGWGSQVSLTANLESWRVAVANDSVTLEEVENMPTIPLPAGVPLFAAGLGVLGRVGRRRAAA